MLKSFFIFNSFFNLVVHVQDSVQRSPHVMGSTRHHNVRELFNGLSILKLNYLCDVSQQNDVALLVVHHYLF